MRIKEYLKESYNELKNKVSWPSWSTLQSSAIVVMIASLLFAIVVFAMDITFRNLMELIYSML